MSFSIGQALNMSQTLKPYSESFLLDTEMILGFIVSKTREYLRAHEDENLTENSPSEHGTGLIDVLEH